MFTAHSIADQYRRFLPGRPDEVVVGSGFAQSNPRCGCFRSCSIRLRFGTH